MPIVIGGIEASLRRFAHYDYWDDAVRRSILLDTRADILVYGPGEIQVSEDRQAAGEGRGPGRDPGDVCRAGRSRRRARRSCRPARTSGETRPLLRGPDAFSNRRLLAQGHADRFVVQYPAPEYKPSDLDWIYGLPFSRTIPEGYPELEMGRFSVVTHRGCFGGAPSAPCPSTRATASSPGARRSILDEIRRLTQHPDWQGFVDDLGGPTANMYGMDCPTPCPDEACMSCPRLDRSHKRLIALLRKARRIPGVKKVFVRSGIRYDLALESRAYIEELCEHHVSGLLKIAPEHVSENVLRLMEKAAAGALEEFRRVFDEIKEGGPGQVGRAAAPQILFHGRAPGDLGQGSEGVSRVYQALEKAGRSPSRASRSSPRPR